MACALVRLCLLMDYLQGREPPGVERLRRWALERSKRGDDELPSHCEIGAHPRSGSPDPAV